MLADRTPGPSLESFAHDHALPWQPPLPEAVDPELGAFEVQILEDMPLLTEGEDAFPLRTSRTPSPVSGRDRAPFLPLEETTDAHLRPEVVAAALRQATASSDSSPGSLDAPTPAPAAGPRTHNPALQTGRLLQVLALFGLVCIAAMLALMVVSWVA